MTGRPIRIKVCNFGENLGMDFAYFCHYLSLKRAFPNVSIELFRSNVDETNCIGLETHHGKVSLPVSSLSVAVVSQRYPDGSDWVQRLVRGDDSLFPGTFSDGSGADYIWGIGMGSSPQWLSRFPGHPWLNSPIVREAVERFNAETGKLQRVAPALLDLGPLEADIVPWDRTLLEHLCYQDAGYPFRFRDEYVRDQAPEQFADYLRVGLRWPDHVRWYYSLDRQYEVLFEILRRLKRSGREVKVLYTLKDGEVGNNFNRGQTLQRLREVQDACDDVLFTYSWPLRPYFGRKTEAEELKCLAHAGIRRVRRVDIWEDLLMSSHCKVYLSDPGGFAEVISMLRKDSTSTFLFPVSFNHASTYITLSRNLRPERLKVSPVTISQSYSCKPTLNPPEEAPRRVIHWDVAFRDKHYRIGNDCHGDDWKYFEEAQATAFREMYSMTRDELINGVVEAALR
jgi:hypothetical protein